MKRFKLMLLSGATTLLVSAGIVGLHSTHAFADTLSEVPGNTTNVEQPANTPKQSDLQGPENGRGFNFAASRISSDFYVYNIAGVQRVRYGTSGLGRPLYYYKIGNGNKTLFANFAIHGYEDSWAQDGYQLTKIAHQLIEKFNAKNKTSGLNGWTVIIVPCANPDGVLDGWTNNGPGRAQISEKIDLNRDFPTFFVPQYNARNYTGPHPLGAPEAKDLATLVAKLSRESRNMVLLDTHGWLDMTIGDPQIGRPFINELGLSRNAGYIPAGHGYFVSYGHAEGAEVSLVELPDTTSASQVTSRNYVGKMYSAMNQVMNNGITGLQYMNKTGVLTGTSTLNIRSGATTVGSILGTYTSGDTIHVVGKINGWYKVYKPGIGYAYVSADYVRLTGDGPAIPGTDSGNSATGWQKVNGSWYYYSSNGTMQKGWAHIDGYWFYFNQSGVMQKGWQQINGSWYYLTNTGAMQTGWSKVDGYWFYFNQSGAMLKGWQQIDNCWYYLTNTGAMQTSWSKIDGYWFYFNQSGAMLKGWQQINGSWYYLTNTGAMQIGWSKIDGYWFYFDQSGAMLKGWQKIDNSWYYLTNTGAMQIGWSKLDGYWFYFNQSGAMLKGWQQINGSWYYLTNTGAMQTGWAKIEGNWFYMYSDGAMATNTTIDGWNIDANGYATEISKTNSDKNTTVNTDNKTNNDKTSVNIDNQKATDNK